MNDGNISRRDWLSGTAGLIAGAAAGERLLADDNPVPTTHKLIQQLSATAPLSMQFRGKSEDDFRKWHTEFAGQLRTCLGPHQPPKQWETIIERRDELEDHVRHQLVLVADGHPRLPVYLLVPKGDKKLPRPGVLALHGHGSHGYEPIVGRDDLPGVAKSIEKANYDYGRQLVRRGYVVAAPCMTPFGRRLESRESYGGGDPCGVTSVRMLLLGKVLMAENLRDCLWAFEMLARHEQVDEERMACVGLSYGGRMTMLTSALEPRIRIAVPSGALNVMQERVQVRYSCGAQVIPGLLQYGDVPEVGSLVAPRYCIWETGSTDGLIKQEWAEAALKRMRRAFRASGAEDHLMVDRFKGGHRWSGRLAYPLMEKVLKPNRKA